MSNIRTLKANVNFICYEIMEECYATMILDPKKDTQVIENLVDEIVEMRNDLIERINKKNVESKKTHFKQIEQDLIVKATDLANRINNL